MSEQIPTQEALKYQPLDILITEIEEPNGAACQAMLSDFRDKFEAFPGSSHNHQCWPGGYFDHVSEIMNIGSVLHDTMSQLRELPFSKSDVLLITFLHDLEKPFKYTYDESGGLVKDAELVDKAKSESFKRDLIAEYGIELTEAQDNALEFVEGIRDDKYRKDSRVMGELAAMCHMADLWSARGWFNHPLPEGQDSWSGAARVNPAASDEWLDSEIY